MNIGVIAFTTEEYYDLSLELIDSVLKFTTFPFTLYTIGFVRSHYNERVNIVQVEEEPDFQNWQTKCFYKHKICSLTSYEVTVYLDTDIIVTKEFEQFFTSRYNDILTSNTLLGNAHPHSPSTDVNFPVRPYINNFFKMFNVEEIPGYLLASLYAYKRDMISFFDELYKKDKTLAQQNIIPIAGDEMTLNLFLYKKQLLEGTDCGFDISPNYSEGFFESYIDDTWETCSKYIKDYKNFNRQVKPILFHGNKDVAYAKYMIVEITNKS